MSHQMSPCEEAQLPRTIMTRLTSHAAAWLGLVQFGMELAEAVARGFEQGATEAAGFVRTGAGAPSAAAPVGGERTEARLMAVASE